MIIYAVTSFFENIKINNKIHISYKIVLYIKNALFL